MNQLRDLLRDEVPAIALSFSDGMSDAEIRSTKASGVDVAELRIDRYRSLDPAHVEEEVQRFAEFPTLATIRSADEGGDWTGSDAERVELFRRVLPYVDGIDVELGSASALAAVIIEAKHLDKVVILSHHNFEATPTSVELDQLAHDAKAAGAEVVKIAATAHSTRDQQTLAEFLVRNAELGLIVIAMGDHGSLSRVFFPALGSGLTYASSGEWVVSGQLTFDETFELLTRFYPEFRQRKAVEQESTSGA